MSVWVLHQTLTPADEEHIQERPGVFLPFDDIPDLTMVTTQGQMREFLTRLYPDSPPESIMLKLDRLWQQYHGLQEGDTVAVPLPNKRAVALGRVHGRYEYQVGKDGRDLHMIPVEWYKTVPSFASFGKYKEIFMGTQRMVEVTDKEARIKIHDKLPHTFNRFVKWKWIIVILVIMQALVFMAGMFR